MLRDFSSSISCVSSDQRFSFLVSVEVSFPSPTPFLVSDKEESKGKSVANLSNADINTSKYYYYPLFSKKKGLRRPMLSLKVKRKLRILSKLLSYCWRNETPYKGNAIFKRFALKKKESRECSSYEVEVTENLYGKQYQCKNNYASKQK